MTAAASARMRGARGRGRGRGGAPPAQETYRGFQEASKEIQENLARHLVKSQEEQISDSDSDVDSEGADELVDRVLDSYQGSSVEPGFLQEAKDLLRNAIQSSVCSRSPILFN